MSRLRFFIVVLLLGPFFCSCAVPAISDPNEAAVRELFKKAVDTFEKGDYKVCEETFRSLLDLKPTRNLALELREQAGYRFFMKLLAKKPLDELARDFLRLAEQETSILLYTAMFAELKGYTIYVDKSFPQSDVEAVILAARAAPQVDILPEDLRRQILVTGHPKEQVIVSIGERGKIGGRGNSYWITLEKGRSTWKIISVERVE